METLIFFGKMVFLVISWATAYFMGREHMKRELEKAPRLTLEPRKSISRLTNEYKGPPRIKKSQGKR